jgi:hypothetical protein
VADFKLRYLSLPGKTRGGHHTYIDVIRAEQQEEINNSDLALNGTLTRWSSISLPNH